MQTSFSMRLSQELSAQLSELAKATGRTKSFIAVQALQDFVERESWQIAEINNGIEEADREEFTSSEEMEKLYKKWNIR